MIGVPDRSAQLLGEVQAQERADRGLEEALSEASAKPVNELMESWIKQTGYPYINASSRLNEKSETVLALRQERFFSDGSKPTAAENYKWKIPMSVMTKSSAPAVHSQFVLENDSDEINLGVLPAGDWIKLNKGTVGIYRTNYSPALLAGLVEPVGDASLHATDRLGLQSDAFALSKAGLMSTAETLKFVLGFRFVRPCLAIHQAQLEPHRRPLRQRFLDQ